jgi:hypothetical protein
MSGSPRDQVGAEIATPENVLLDATERVGRIRDGRFAVHLHLSRLRPQNRQEGNLRVAGRMLEPMVSAYRGQIFRLTNDDIVFMVLQPNPSDLRDHLHRLRGLFAKDPLTQDDSGDGTDLFCTIYDLAFDYDIFLALVQERLAAAKTRLRAPPSPPEPKPLDATSLALLLERLGMIDASPFVRRQSAISLGGPQGQAQGQAEVIFQEFFISLTDLQRAVAPDLNLQSNRWIFQHLSTTLDQRLLAAMRTLQLAAMPPSLHVNLTLPSLADPSFAAFEAGRDQRITLGVELRILDVLADSRAFFATRENLRAKNIRLVIDGLDESTLRFMDVGRTGADLYKLDWNPELAQPTRGEGLMNALKEIDPSRLLLARCDSETAIAWGMDRGISQFQGRYVEAMLAATTMAVCETASACSLAQCTQRHGVITGPLRGECGNHQRLDKAPSMRAPNRKKP